MQKKLFSILALLLMAVTGVTAQTTYSVTVKDGTEDADKWTATPNPATAGQTVTVKYTGTKKVKSVKAVKKAPAGPTPITLAAKLAYTGGEIADFTDATDDDDVGRGRAYRRTLRSGRHEVRG